MKFYKCSVCGKIITILDGNENIPTVCCNKEMVEVKPNTIEASTEKHLPVYKFIGKNLIEVKVGVVYHPSMENHHIEWIMLETNEGTYIKYLKWDDLSITNFLLKDGEKALKIYALCNLHGIWETAII